MAITLNLLPQDQVVDTRVVKFVKVLRSLNMVFIGVFVVFVLGAGVLFYMNNSKLKTLTKETIRLKEEVSSLEVSEQQVVLLKDRIKKIQTVQAIPSSLRNMKSVDTLLSTIPENVSVTELGLDAKKIDLSLKFKSNFELQQFLDGLKGSPVFKSAVITSFGLSPTTGYLVSFDLSGN